MKKLLTIALALTLALSVTACGKTDVPATPEAPAVTPSAEAPAAAPENDAPSESGEFVIDLSQFTPRELPASSLLEDWMKPTFGVITSGGETLPDFMYQFTVSGVSKADEESYRQLIESKGFTVHSTSYTYRKDGIQIALGTAGIETTSDSIMTITIEKY